MLCCNDFAAVGTLQKLAPLHFSEVDTSTKMEAAVAVSNATTELLVANPKTDEHKSKMSLAGGNPQLSVLHMPVL